MPIPEDKRNTAGFDKHPENINKKGRGVSIKNQLKEILLKDGELPIPKNQFIRMQTVNDKEYYIFKVPTQDALSLKLLSMAMGKNNNAFQALKLIQEMYDGKSQQSIDHKSTDGSMSPLKDETEEELQHKLDELRKTNTGD